ncbi:MAG: hypothetical protein ACTHOO_10670 [Alcanivorax sp.]
MIKAVQEFFYWSDWFDYMVTKRLSHLKTNWELIWDHETRIYVEEDDSFARILNDLVYEISVISPPENYHDCEDRLAEFCKGKLGWQIEKVRGRWEGAPYSYILEQGAFDDIGQRDLCLAIRGRVQAAIDRGQEHFDDMEELHQKMLAEIFVILLYHREMQI